MSEEALQQPQPTPLTEPAPATDSRDSSRPNQTREVKVWCDGLPQPLPAVAVSSAEGLCLRLDLPHLRQNSQVFVSFNDNPGVSLTGALGEVRLERGQQPRLRVRVRSEVAGALGLEDCGTADEIPLVVEQPPEQEPGPTLEIVSEATPEQELLELASETPYTLTDRDQTEISVWSMTLPENAGSASGVFGEPQWQDPPRQRHLWLWGTALSMTLVALGSMAYTGLLGRLGDRVSSWVSRPSLAAPAPAPVASAKMRAAAGLEVLPAARPPEPAAESPEPMAKAAKPEPKAPEPGAKAAKPEPKAPEPVAKAAEPRAAEPEPEPRAAEPAPPGKDPLVRLDGQLASLVIPLGGSTGKADAYLLQDPYALAINLPRARRLVRKSTFRPAQGPFRLIWVRKRKGGVHLRVFFRGGKPEHKLEIGQRQVRISVPGGHG